MSKDDLNPPAPLWGRPARRWTDEEFQSTQCHELPLCGNDEPVSSFANDVQRIRELLNPDIEPMSGYESAMPSGWPDVDTLAHEDDAEMLYVDGGQALKKEIKYLDVQRVFVPPLESRQKPVLTKEIVLVKMPSLWQRFKGVMGRYWGHA